ncbi:hypothetical protein [Legionella fairfieldensis]|uniref:hypothetical protein n=1 Tax=Legionella fairfieldensis TaxID=45064 RepID=UPI00048CDCD6|nr:hypothetical protein [Legionella fairfieldensis]
MSFYRATASLFMITLSFCSMAATNSFPHGCEVTGFGFDQNYLILNDNGAQSFYLVQNRSNNQVELQRYETRDVFMSPPLTARLDPSNWAAFASDVENLHFQCFINESEGLTKIDCRDVLEVCKYPRAKFALSNMGNYWVATNKTQSQVINEATSKGIYLRW